MKPRRDSSKDVCAIHHSYLSEFLARVREEKRRVTAERYNETETGSDTPVRRNTIIHPPVESTTNFRKKN
jgi:hypothetical protein